ncbi:hypothetical protein DUNSADRAFT_6008 [Dunaliella salina]|uniref:ABC transporter domain-containing protein n=1 Tax=Dunaliella salina TaxID=3046 RepID=A0ABQ7GP41_DUNSA|nr:hypothetical protein DUNSADRAFT_6008 [Dunaliella salina]|eukprot:KAF5836372.1 hypothetical protein DUNSADRAFT_6008 [Dunaliella salina]
MRRCLGCIYLVSSLEPLPVHDALPLHPSITTERTQKPRLPGEDGSTEQKPGKACSAPPGELDEALVSSPRPTSAQAHLTPPSSRPSNDATSLSRFSAAPGSPRKSAEQLSPRLLTTPPTPRSTLRQSNLQQPDFLPVAPTVESTPPSSSFQSTDERATDVASTPSPCKQPPSKPPRWKCFGLGAEDRTPSELPGGISIPEVVEESTEDGMDPQSPSKPHKGTSFAKHVDALTRKSAVYQRRKACTNACLLVGPIFFPILMFALQAATNALFLGRDEFKCGCKCVSCCKDVIKSNGTLAQECGPVDFGSCESQDGKCEKFDEDTCGIRYSKPVQAVWCAIKRPSTWPPVMDMPRTRYFPPPYGPFQAMPMLYTSDSEPAANTDSELSYVTPGSGGGAAGRRLLRSRPDLTPDLAPDISATLEPRSYERHGNGRSLLVDNFFVANDDASVVGNNSSRDAVTEMDNSTSTQEEGYLYREDWQWEVETGINGTAVDAPQLVANSMMNLPRSNPSPTNGFQVLNILQNLIVQDNSTGDVTINGHLLALLGFKFASAHSEPMQYYIDTTFINEGENSETDVVLVTMPNKTCEERGLQYDIYQKQAATSNATGEPFVYWVTRIYDPATFLIKFYSYDIEGLEEFLEEQDFDPREQIQGTQFERVKMGCVDAPTKRLSSQESMDDTLFCGWYQGKPVGKAECFKKYNESMYGPTESYAAGFHFGPDISLSNFTAVVQSNELLGVMSFPKLDSSLTIDFSSLIGPLFYTWVVQLALPSMLQQLVYEKEFRLRVIMKMHGLPDSAYWIVSYVWNFLACKQSLTLVMIQRHLKRRPMQSAGVQAVFYILYGQVQMAFTFFLSSLFSNSRTAVVAGYVYVLASGLLGFLLFQPLMDQAYWWLWLIELIPAFALYRGLYEFGAYAFVGAYSNTIGLTFDKLDDPKNGMVTVWIIMAVEWAVFMVLAWYTEQVIPTGNGTPRHPLFFIEWMWRRKDKVEVARVEALLRQPPDHMPVITSVHLRKLFPSLGGTAPKLAVKDMTIGISQGECVGLLGLSSNTRHRAWLQGCADREEGLHSVALHGLVGNKLAGEYSGGMRRRLSVGMAFMGQPRVVYLDEPSTGLDPMSRKQLWSVVKAHKASCAIILTTHSMQEAELLCDRIGIFVDGQLVCLDTPSEITSRFAGFLVLTVTVPLEQEPQARKLAEGLTPEAHLSYALGGTLKYELPKDQVTLSDVFKAVHAAKDAGLCLDDWAVTSATLEEVFIKLARVADDSHLV